MTAQIYRFPRKLRRRVVDERAELLAVYQACIRESTHRQVLDLFWCLAPVDLQPPHIQKLIEPLDGDSAA